MKNDCCQHNCFLIVSFFVSVPANGLVIRVKLKTKFFANFGIRKVEGDDAPDPLKKIQ